MKINPLKITLCLLSILLLSSCAIDFRNKIKGNKNVITQEREVNTSFNKIAVSQGIELSIKMDEVESIHVKADENLHEHIKTEISNNLLKIYVDGYISTSKAKTVFVTIPNISNIKASSGSSVNSENILMSDDLQISSSSGSTIKVNVDTENLHVDTSSGSTTKIEGKTVNCTLESSSGSTFNAYDLEAKTAKAKASSGASIQLTIIDKATLKASSGATIKYKGNPELTNSITSSGGNIHKR